VAQREAWKVVGALAPPASRDRRAEIDLLGSLRETYDSLIDAVDDFASTAPAALRARQEKTRALQRQVRDLEDECRAAEARARRLDERLAAATELRAKSQLNVNDMLRERFEAQMAPWKAVAMAHFVRTRVKRRVSRVLEAKKIAAVFVQSARRRIRATKVVDHLKEAERKKRHVETASATSIQTAYRARLGRKKRRARVKDKERRSLAAKRLQAVYRGRLCSPYARSLVAARTATAETNDALDSIASTSLFPTLKNVERNVARFAAEYDPDHRNDDVDPYSSLTDSVAAVDNRLGVALKQASNVISRLKSRDDRAFIFVNE